MNLDERGVVRSTWEKAIRPALLAYVATLSAMFSGLSLAVWLLFLGAIGQECLYLRFVTTAPDWLVTVPILIPWLIVFFLSYFKQAPFGPRPFRYCLIFAACWYSIVTILGEALSVVLKPTRHDVIVDTVAHLLTFIGALSLIILVRTSIAIRRYENTVFAHLLSEVPRCADLQSCELVLPRQYSYDPGWLLIVCSLGVGSAVLSLTRSEGIMAFQRIAFIFGFALIVLALLMAIRRLRFKRELLLDIDALTLPTGPFQMRNARILYSSIEEVWLVELPLTQLICFSTKEGRFQIPSTMIQEKDSFVALWNFLHLRVQSNRRV